MAYLHKTKKLPPKNVLNLILKLVFLDSGFRFNNELNFVTIYNR